MPSQRIKIYHLATHLLADLLSGEYYVKVNGIPKGARVACVRAFLDYEMDSVAVVLRHPDWPEVGEACRPPDGGLLTLEAVTSLEWEQARELRTEREKRGLGTD